MAEGVNGDTLFSDSGSNLGPAEGALDTAFGHGRGSVLCSITVSAKGGEEEARVAVGHPIAAEQIEGRWGKRDVAILGALSTMDMDHHAAAVDIGDFEVETFMESHKGSSMWGQAWDHGILYNSSLILFINCGSCVSVCACFSYYFAAELNVEGSRLTCLLSSGRVKLPESRTNHAAISRTLENL